MSTNCPNCGWPQDQPLSRIDVSSPQSSVVEGNEAPARGITFIATRTGPRDQACSVAASLSGSASVADFVEGTAMSGVAEWPAGDNSPRSVTLPLNADRVVEGDETVILTLSDAVNCTVGVDKVTVKIVNDDLPPPTGYDGDLPYGGQGMGTACLLGQPGNQRTTGTAALAIRCERTGQIDRLAWNNRFNGHNRTGYSTGNGGVISWRLSIAKDTTTSPIDAGPVLGETRKITKPIHAASWQGEWEAAGGRGPCDPQFAEYPTIRLLKPVAVNAGDPLVWTQVQHAPATGSEPAAYGTVSINNNYSQCRHYDDWSPFTLHRSCRQFKVNRLDATRPEHFPNILYGYVDGVVKGTGVLGYAAGMETDEECIILGGRTRARQCFTVPDWADGRSIRRVISWWGRYDAEATGVLRCRLEAAGSDPFGASDEGTVFASATVNASAIALRPKPKFGDPSKLIRHVFEPRPRPLKKGEVIYVELSSTGSRFIGFRCVRWLSYAPVGLKKADWGMKGMGGQRDTGSGWKTLNVGGVDQDIPIWAEF